MVMVMACFSLLLHSSLGLLQLTTADTIVLPACKTVAGGSTDFDVNFCVSVLKSDGRSVKAKDYRDLALIAVDLVADNATSTVAEIDLLLHDSNTDNATAQRLRSCRELYDDIVQSQPQCGTAVRDRRYGDAKSCLDRSADGVTKCKDRYVKNEVGSPLTEENRDAFKLARLSADSGSRTPCMFLCTVAFDYGGSVVSK